MFGLVRKKEIKKYLSMLREGNRAVSLSQVYIGKPTKEQRDKNLYLQGYQDGCDNIMNAVCSHFNIK